MRHHRRRALSLLSGIALAPRPPRGGWHRNDPGDGGGDGTAGGGPAGGGANDDAGDDKPGDDGKKPTFTGDFDPDKARAAIAAARAGEKTAKAEAKAEKDRVAAILKAAGLAPDGKVDPETQVKSLTDRATAAEQRAEALAVQLAVRDAATKHSANTTELLDSTKFLGQLKELDTAASDYGDKVAALVAKAVKDNPARYGTTGAKGGGTRSGTSDHNGGGSARTRPGLGAAIAARMNS
jgi:hypothetical protein